MNNIYKKNPSEYSDWEKFNPSGGHGQLGRFTSEILTCTNNSCERHNKEISEKEAFYLFAKLGFLRRVKPVFLPSKLLSLYVCPFCHRRGSLHPGNNNISTL